MLVPRLRRRSLPLLTAVLALALVPASAHATTQFGQVDTGNSVCSLPGLTSAIYAGTTAPAPTGGRITTLETKTRVLGGDTGRFKVLRPTGAPLTYKVIADGPSFTENVD